ncbi:MAG TPA: fibronectin type III domain-containing protein [Candidatus Angelobacter sp.]|nr:fibronectin type III domain-containing protein [Candidatus Angelobacter sp.]
MNPVVVALVIGLAVSGALNTAAEQEVSPAAAQSSSATQSIQQLPAPAPVSPIGTANNAVQITNGPVVENVTDTTAEIAWSTNVNAGTMLHYGADPSHLDLTAGMPWGGLTHRVILKDLKPNTTYYFRAESSQGQGTGTQAQTEQTSFQTKPAGVASQLR